MNQEQLHLVLKLELHGFSHNAEADFSLPNVDSGVCISQEWPPEYERDPEISLHVEDHKVREYECVPKFYQEVLHDSFGIPHGRVRQLYTHGSREKCRIA